MDVKKPLFLAIVILPFIPQVSSSTKYAGEFLELGIGARPQGMGSAFVALSADATSPYWNAAGCGALDSGEVFLMHSERFAGIVKYDCAAWVHPAVHPSGGRGYGALVSRVGVDGIRLWGERSDTLPPQNPVDPDTLPSINVADYCLQLAYGLRRRTLSVGGSLKLVWRSMGDNRAFGSGIDLGLLFAPRKGISFGASLRDVTSTILVWDTGTKEYIIPSLKSGLALSRGIDFLPGRLTFAMDVDVKFENQKSAAQLSAESLSADVHLGGECWYKEMFALRAGSDLGHFTMGCGIVYKRYRFDYAYLSNDDWGGSHRISGSLMLR